VFCLRLTLHVDFVCVCDMIVRVLVCWSPPPTPPPPSLPTQIPASGSGGFAAQASPLHASASSPGLGAQHAGLASPTSPHAHGPHRGSPTGLRFPKPWVRGGGAVGRVPSQRSLGLGASGHPGPRLWVGGEQHAEGLV
jgi:hypothetical protein